MKASERKTDQKVYDEGATAFAHKMGEANPYPDGTTEHKSWEYGFLDAQNIARLPRGRPPPTPGY
jgi:hypothetical protein